MTLARRAENSGATSPVASTAANRAPTDWTQPDPLEWATLDRATTVMKLPTTGPYQDSGWTPLRRRCPVGGRRQVRRRGAAATVVVELKGGERRRRQ